MCRALQLAKTGYVGTKKIINMEIGYFQWFLIVQLMRCKKDESVYFEDLFWPFLMAEKCVSGITYYRNRQYQKIIMW